LKGGGFVMGMKGNRSNKTAKKGLSPTAYKRHQCLEKNPKKEESKRFRKTTSAKAPKGERADRKKDRGVPR